MLLGLGGWESCVMPYLVHGIICREAEFQAAVQIASRSSFGFQCGRNVLASLEAEIHLMRRRSQPMTRT